MLFSGLKRSHFLISKPASRLKSIFKKKKIVILELPERDTNSPIDHANFALIISIKIRENGQTEIFATKLPDSDRNVSCYMAIDSSQCVNFSKSIDIDSILNDAVYDYGFKSNWNKIIYYGASHEDEWEMSMDNSQMVIIDGPFVFVDGNVFLSNDLIFEIGH